MIYLNYNLVIRYTGKEEIMKCFVRAFAVICIVAVIGAFYYARCNNSGATDVITPLKMNLCEEVPRFIDAQKYENQYIYNYKKDGLDIYLCCNDAEAYNYETAASWVHLWINGSEYVLNSLDKPAFMHGSSTSPELVIEDFNDDGIDDIMVFIESERLGILQQALISKSDTSYDNIGTISWAQDMDGSFGGQGLTYNISYNLDEEKAWLDVSDYTDVSNELRPDTEVLDTVRNGVRQISSFMRKICRSFALIMGSRALDVSII